MILHTSTQKHDTYDITNHTFAEALCADRQVLVCVYGTCVSNILLGTKKKCNMQ